MASITNLLDNVTAKNGNMVWDRNTSNKINISGTEARVVFEFPNYNSKGESMVILMDDIISISYSTYTSKPPVMLLGSQNIQGYGLGNRTVAGSVVRTVFTEDKLSAFQLECYRQNQEQIEENLKKIDSTYTPGRVDLKDKIAFMKDDLASFNIHIICISELTNGVGIDIGTSTDHHPLQRTGVTPNMKSESIIGCILINNGQVYSIEDLITENTFSFQAKAVKSGITPADYNRGVSHDRLPVGSDFI